MDRVVKNNRRSFDSSLRDSLRMTVFSVGSCDPTHSTKDVEWMGHGWIGGFPP
jgi:hypothetical protein